MPPYTEYVHGGVGDRLGVSLFSRRTTFQKVSGVIKNKRGVWNILSLAAHFLHIKVHFIFVVTLKYRDTTLSIGVIDF